MTRIKNVNSTLRKIADVCPDLVFGKFLKGKLLEERYFQPFLAWPLIKVLDIGGDQVGCTPN